MSINDDKGKCWELFIIDGFRFYVPTEYMFEFMRRFPEAQREIKLGEVVFNEY